MLLTDSGKLLLIFFCHKVEVVIAKRAMKEDITPIIGRLDPISKPKTNTEPKKRKKTPAHTHFGHYCICNLYIYI